MSQSERFCTKKKALARLLGDDLHELFVHMMKCGVPPAVRTRRDAPMQFLAGHTVRRGVTRNPEMRVHLAA